MASSHSVDGLLSGGLHHELLEALKLSVTEQSPAFVALMVFSAVVLVYISILEPLYFGRLSHVPGPKLTLSWYYLTYFDFRYNRTDKITEWHKKYGPGEYSDRFQSRPKTGTDEDSGTYSAE